MITAAQVVAEARVWLGVPYVHQGRSKYGVDCIGLVLCVRDAVESWPLGRTFVRTYARRPQDSLLLSIVEQHGQRIEQPEDGCMILIRWPRTPCPTHAGIYAGGNIIHAYQRAKCVVETGFRSHWLRDAHSYWRLPGVS